MDPEQARKLEAERTLQRIRGTLKQLDEEQPRPDPANREEFRWMQSLIEDGYRAQRRRVLYRRLAWLLLATAALGLLLWLLP